MTRIIVRNLPKYLQEDRLKEHFGKQGHITDVKLLKKKSGVSRCFGYIGFKTDREANAAVRFFNNTYIDTSKISVELSLPTGDPSLPKSFSRYAQKKQQKEFRQKQRAAREEAKAKKEENAVPEHIKLLNQAKSDDLLKEYLGLMQPRSKAKTWANDDIVSDKVHQSNIKANIIAVPNKKAGGEGQLLTKTHLKFDDEEEDALYEDLPSNKNASEPSDLLQSGANAQVIAVANKKTGGEGQLLTKTHITFDDNEDEDLPPKADDVVFNPAVSDLDYLKSRMIKEPSKDEAEIGPDDLRNNKEEEGTTVESQTEMPTINPQDNKQNTPAVPAKVNSELSPESQIMDNGRLFVRNLPYTCTEDDLKKAFEKFGPISEIHMPISVDTKSPKGFAYVMYLLPEHALKAYKILDRSFFQGRLLHVLPAAEKLTQEPDLNDESLSYKKKAELKKRASSTSNHNWNSLFMSSDAIADAISDRLGMSKGEVLDPTASNVAVRLAMAETQIIMETKQYFEDNGFDLAQFDQQERSDTVILVKNIPFGTSEQQLRDLFGKHGDLGRVLIPPAKTIAVVEFLAPTEARAAFRHLAYRRFGDAPIYLEKAPKGILKDAFNPESHGVGTVKTSVTKEDKGLIMDQLTEGVLSSDPIEGATLFVKNLNFTTTQSVLHEALKHLTGLRSATIKTKPDHKNPGSLLSMGFGFAEFDSKENAAIAMKSMQGFRLEGHTLTFKVSHRGGDGTAIKTQNATTTAAPQGTKILVKNIPFEATTKELRELFSTFGQLKSLRLPKKFEGGHRGFCFLEFLTKKEAQNVMNNVAHTHLYGRHLVLEYAEDETSIDALRDKVARQVAKDNQAPEPKKRKIEMPDEKNKMDIDDI